MITVQEEIIDKITESIYYVLSGKKKPVPLELPDNYPDNEIRQVISYMNRFIAEYNEFAEFMSSMARGELDFSELNSKMEVSQSFKHLRSNLKHLTWKTQRIADGDFSQAVDFMGDFSTAFNNMTQQLKAAFEKIEFQNEELKKAHETISVEKAKSEQLLLNILPLKVVEDLKQHGKTDPQIFEDVTVYFSDIVDFTSSSSIVDPKILISELNEIFTAFDEIMTKNHCERIKTIGDAYLAVCGMPASNPDHARNIQNAALEIRDYLLKRQNAQIDWKIRVGIHTGKVVGGVVGIKKYIYDVFGETINTASRMESNSEPMKINVSESTHQITRKEYHYIERESFEVKDNCHIKMYFLEGR
jgi:class 3 adenylate cyclase